MNQTNQNHGAAPKKEGGGWKRDLMVLLRTKGKVTAGKRKKPVSNRTQDKREEVLFLCFTQLGQLGHHLRSADALRETHVRVLAMHWEKEGISPATLQNRISILRVFAEWVDKKGMVKEAISYVSNPDSVRRTTVATADQSWSAKGVDVQALIKRAGEVDRYVGMQLELMLIFSLRRQEAVMLRPHRADHGDYLEVEDGTKGGRQRNVRISTDYERDVLERAKKMVRGLNGHVGHPDKNLRQSLERFNYVMKVIGATRKELGVTSHGLRHQGLNDLFEEIAGVASPVRGGQDLWRQVDPDRLAMARACVAERAGHSRLSISGSYIGGLVGRKGRYKLTEAQEAKWVRLYQLRLLGQNRSRKENLEYDDLVGKLISTVAGPVSGEGTGGG